MIIEVLPRGYTVRPSRPEDLDAMTHLAQACELELYDTAETTLEEMQHYWQDPDFNRETDSWVIFSPDGRLAAWARTDHHEHARIYLDAHVHPEYRGHGVGTYILQLAEQWAHQHSPLAAPDVRIVLSTGEENRNGAARSLLEQNGFQVVRQIWRMAIEMQEAPAEPRWPAGIAVSTMTPGMERAIFEADEEVFKDHWGHIPSTFEAWRHWMGARENFDPTLWFVAMDGEQIAAISLCGIEQASGAWVHVLGVRRPWRRQGLALALLQHSFREFFRRGLSTVYLMVDAQSLTGATRLYERAGMHVVRQRDRYEKELRAGREISTQTVEG